MEKYGTARQVTDGNVMNETRFKFWKELFKFSLYQEDMQASYSCHNEETLV